MLPDIDSVRKKKQPACFIVLLILAGCLLRFKGLTYQSLWFDELASALISDPASAFLSVIKDTLQDNHPPLYQVLLWAWYNFFGYTEFSGRSLSAIIGSCGIIAMYYLARELFNSRIAFYSALISVFNYFLIFYSQETRSYALLFLLTCISWYFFLQIMRQKRKWPYVAYTVSTVFLLYTHYYGFLVLLSQVTILFVFLQFRIKNLAELKYFLPAMGVLLLSIIPLAPYMFAMATRESWWLEQPAPWFIIGYIRKYFDSYILTVVFCVLIVFGIKTTLHVRESAENFKWPLVLILIWLGISYLVPYIRGFVSLPMLHVRYTIICLPAIIMLVALGINNIRKPGTRNLIIALVAFGSFMTLNYTIEYYTKIDKEQYREAITSVLKLYGQEPVYACHSRSINTYLKLLGSPVRSFSYQNIIPVLERDNINEKIWVISSTKHKCDKFVNLIKTKLKNGSLYATENIRLEDMVVYRLTGIRQGEKTGGS